MMNCKLFFPNGKIGSVVFKYRPQVGKIINRQYKIKEILITCEESCAVLLEDIIPLLPYIPWS